MKKINTYSAPELMYYNAVVEQGFSISIDQVFEDPTENPPIQWEIELIEL